jgi:hypothetical protein
VLGYYEQIDELKAFRSLLHRSFSSRRDAIFECIDAISSNGHKVSSVVELSQADCFSRQYSSLTDAISDGVKTVDINEVSLKTMNRIIPTEAKRLCWLLDATANPRVHSPCLSDRSIVHTPNAVPGNKPITSGHSYSALAYHPQHNDHWIVPVSIQRVPSDQKSNEFGMKQLSRVIDSIEDSCLHISIGDSLYGTLNCRKESSQHKDLIHITRLRSNRNVWSRANTSSEGDKGRKKVFGQKLLLNEMQSSDDWDDQSQSTINGKNSKKVILDIKVRKNLLLRGDRKFRSEHYPLDVYCIKAIDEHGKAIYKNPLWLGVCGERRGEITLEEAASYYRSRYDIEHFFRFGKTKLLMTEYQTPETKHEEGWMLLVMLAHQQLYLARHLARSTPEPWERYLPVFKNKHSDQASTPTMTQRGFGKLIKKIGTPAKTAIPRGKPIGRIAGTLQEKRQHYDIKFKGKKNNIQLVPAINSGFEYDTIQPKPKKIESLIDQIKTELKKSKISAKDICERLLDSS